MDAGKAQQISTYRLRVLAVVESSAHALTGRQIALAACMSYKQTIDALNALYNYGKVQRTGKKFVARWSRVQPQQQCMHHLDVMFLRMMAKKNSR